MTQVEHPKETHVRYSRKIRIELKEELDQWLEKRQAMLVLGIESNAVDSEAARIKWLQEENKKLHDHVQSLRGANEAWKAECDKLKEGSVPSGSEQSKKDGDRIKELSRQLERADYKVKELNEECMKLTAKVLKLQDERKAEENPSLAGSENIVLRKKIAELEAELKARPVSADARQMKMLSDAALKADEEIARLKAEIVRKDYWFEHTPMEDKAKKGWVMYFQLKKSMEAKGQFDQEAAS